MGRARFSDSGSRPYFIRPGSKWSVLQAGIARRAFLDPSRFYMMYEGERVHPDHQVPAPYNPPVDVTLRMWTQSARSRSRTRTLRPQRQQRQQPDPELAPQLAQEDEAAQPVQQAPRVVEIVDTQEMSVQTDGPGYAGPTGIRIQVRGHPYPVDLYLRRDEVLRVYEGWDELPPKHVERACLNIYPKVFERGGRMCLLDGIHVMRPDRPIPREHWESATLYAVEDLVLGSNAVEPEQYQVARRAVLEAMGGAITQGQARLLLRGEAQLAKRVVRVQAKHREGKVVESAAARYQMQLGEPDATSTPTGTQRHSHHLAR